MKDQNKIQTDILPSDIVHFKGQMAIERKPGRVARFVAGERLEDAVRAKGNGVARGGGR